MLAEPLKSFGKLEEKNVQNRKEFLKIEKGKEIQKGKEKKIRVQLSALPSHTPTP